MCNLNIFTFKWWGCFRGKWKTGCVFTAAIICLKDTKRKTYYLFSVSKKITSSWVSLWFYYFGRHKMTRHLYYLQLRRDILEDRLPFTEETGLFLSALALQAEFGDILPEVLPNCKLRMLYPLCRFLQPCLRAWQSDLLLKGLKTAYSWLNWQ